MLGLNTPGMGVWLSRSDAPKRKLAWTLELVEADGGLVGVNTMHPNRLVAEALAADAIPELAGYDVHRREVRYRRGKPGRLHADRAGPAAGLRRGEELSTCAAAARWPSSPIASPPARRSTCASWPREVARGNRAVQLFVVQRTDCERFPACADLDPAYAAGLEAAADAGVEVWSTPATSPRKR